MSLYVYAWDDIQNVQVRSGRSDALLLEMPGRGGQRFGQHTASDADFDGDGRVDVMGSWHDTRDDSAAVDVYRHDGSLLHRLPYRAFSLAAMPDVDGDGCDEILIGAPLLTDLGSVFLISGRTGAVIRESNGERPGDFLGSGDVRGCGDLDADGVPDYAGSGFGASTDGIVIAFSGATGAVLRSWRRPPLEQFGRYFACADLDRDGVPDFVMAGNGILRWHSGRDGQHVGTIHSTGGQGAGLAYNGFDIGALRPDDAFPPIGATACCYMQNAGRLPALGLVELFRPVPTNVRTVGVACAGRFDKAPAIGFRELVPGASARIHLSSAPPASFGFLILGASDRTHLGLALPLALDPVGLNGCLLYNSIDCIVPVVTGTAGIDRGYSCIDVPQAAFRLYAQWIVLGANASGFDAAASRGLSW